MGLVCFPSSTSRRHAARRVALVLRQTAPAQAAAVLGGRAQVSAQLGTCSIVVQIGDRAVLSGALWADIKAGESTWYVCDGVLQLSLLKRSRRGQYGNGRTNADTFWMAVCMHGDACCTRSDLHVEPECDSQC